MLRILPSMASNSATVNTNRQSAALPQTFSKQTPLQEDVFQFSHSNAVRFGADAAPAAEAQEEAAPEQQQEAQTEPNVSGLGDALRSAHISAQTAAPLEIEIQEHLNSLNEAIRLDDVKKIDASCAKLEEELTKVKSHLRTEKSEFAKKIDDNHKAIDKKSLRREDHKNNIKKHVVTLRAERSKAQELEAAGQAGSAEHEKVMSKAADLNHQFVLMDLKNKRKTEKLNNRKNELAADRESAQNLERHLTFVSLLKAQIAGVASKAKQMNKLQPALAQLAPALNNLQETLSSAALNGTLHQQVNLTGDVTRPHVSNSSMLAGDDLLSQYD